MESISLGPEFEGMLSALERNPGRIDELVERIFTLLYSGSIVLTPEQQDQIMVHADIVKAGTTESSMNIAITTNE